MYSLGSLPSLYLQPYFTGCCSKEDKKPPKTNHVGQANVSLACETSSWSTLRGWNMVSPWQSREFSWRKYRSRWRHRAFCSHSGRGGADPLLRNSLDSHSKKGWDSWVWPDQIYVCLISVCLQNHVSCDSIWLCTCFYIFVSKTYFKLLFMVLNLQLNAQAQGCIYI